MIYKVNYLVLETLLSFLIYLIHKLYFYSNLLSLSHNIRTQYQFLEPLSDVVFNGRQKPIELAW